ncbi:hypothetical protein ABK040_007725 [Willaertia magna]
MVENPTTTQNVFNNPQYYRSNSSLADVDSQQPLEYELEKEQQLPQEDDNTKKQQDDAHLSSNLSSLINIIKANIGSGILGMPFAFRCSGYWLGLFSIGIIMFICVHCTLLLVDSKREINKQRKKRNEKEIITFQQVGGAAFGKPATVIITILLIFTQLGFCCAYMTFIASNLMSIFHTPINVFYKFLFISITGICAFPFCLIRNLKHLSIFSIISEITLIIGCLIVVYYSIVKIVTEPFPGDSRNLQPFNFERFPTFFGICLFAFEGIGLVLPIENNMKNKKAYPSLLYIGLTIISVSMTFFGLVGYFSYGMGVNSLITLNIPKEGVLPLLVKINFIVALLLTYPMQIFPVSQMIDHLLAFLKRKLRNEKEEMKENEDDSSSNEIDNNNNIENGEIVGNNNNQQLETTPSVVKLSELLKSPHFHLENLMRLLLIMATAFLSALIPSFGDFLGLIGGMGGTLMALLFPCAIHLKVFWKKISWIVIIKDSLLLLFSLFAAGFTTYISVKDLISNLAE